MRLIDLHCNWALQYACESSQYDPALYADIPGRVNQVDGYLTATSATLLSCGRSAGDWASHRDPWRTLGEMLARYEAEFSGRLLFGPDDVARWQAEPSDFICWGVLGIGGFDALMQSPADLDRLPGLFDRGVRIFQPVETEASRLAGAEVPDDDRGLTDLGREFLARLLALSPPADQTAPRPVVDLADLNARSTSDVLDWFEQDPSRIERLLILRSHGTIAPPSRPGQVV